MISSARSSMSSRPCRSHSERRRWAPDLAGRHLGVQVAGHVVGLAHVGEDELPHVGVALAGDHQPADRDPEALLEHVAGAGADAVAADVGVVDRRAEEGDHPAVAEHRVQHRDVEQLAGRLVRVVGDQHVALDERVGRVLVEDRRRGAGERVDVAGRAGDGLGDHPAAAVEHGVGEVAGLAHDRRERGALQRPGLLVDRGDEALPQHLELDRIERSVVVPSRSCPSSWRSDLVRPVAFGDERAVGGDGGRPAGADHGRRLALLDDRRADERWPTPRSVRR